MTIRNFYSYSDEKLFELIDSLGLSMDIELLRFCKQHCAKLNKMDISDSELRIIDEVFKVTPTTAENAAISELVCENSDIIETFNDLLAKSAHLSGESAPLSLSSATQVSSKYMRMIGLKTPPIPEEIIEESEKKDHSLITDIIDVAASYDKNSLVTAVANRIHNEKFEIDELAFCEHFLSTINKLISSMLSFIAYGYDRQLISLCLKYNFPKDADSLTLGNCLAMILGAYRVTCELCMTDVSQIARNEYGEVSLSVSPFVGTKKGYMPSKLNANHSKLYLLSFNRLENGMPDFESFRNMCDRYHTLASHGKIKSALAVNGNLRDAINKMEGTCRFIENEKAADILDESFCGILLESYLFPKNAVVLGNVELIPQTTEPEATKADNETEDNTSALVKTDENTVSEAPDVAPEEQNEVQAVEQIEKNTQENSEENSEIC